MIRLIKKIMTLLRKLGIARVPKYCGKCVHYDDRIKGDCDYNAIPHEVNETPFGVDLEWIRTHTCQELNHDNRCVYFYGSINVY